jgi:hypothetical protein
MAFTRFHDDPDRIMKKLQESTDQGLYYLNQPGNGDKVPFIRDSQVILQKWGANLHHDRIQVESNLMGIPYKLSRDCSRPTFHTSPIQYPEYKKEVTCQPRTIAPVWTARDLEQSHRWDLPLDPQSNVIIPFHANISTRVLEKDSIKI